MKPLFFCIISLMALLVSNCSGDSGTIAENEALKAECDSLRNEFSKLQSRANKREAFLDSLCLYLDSISEQEHILVQTSDPETNRRYTRAEMRKRIQELGEIIARQREHIQALAEHYSMLSATEDPGRIQSLMNITLHLQNQIDTKEQEIFALSAELENSVHRIGRLNNEVSRLNNKITDVTAENSALESTVARQADIINEAYVLIATKQELQAMGVLSKGNIIKKSKFSVDNLDLSKCRKIDITKVRQFQFKSKKPKILTSVPSESYSIQDNGSDNKTLLILNPKSFWSISNILVIQL